MSIMVSVSGLMGKGSVLWKFYGQGFALPFRAAMWRSPFSLDGPDASRTFVTCDRCVRQARWPGISWSIKRANRIGAHHQRRAGVIGIAEMLHSDSFSLRVCGLITSSVAGSTGTELRDKRDVFFSSNVPNLPSLGGLMHAEEGWDIGATAIHRPNEADEWTQYVGEKNSSPNSAGCD